jgi:hypothetical protein
MDQHKPYHGVRELDSVPKMSERYRVWTGKGSVETAEEMEREAGKRCAHANVDRQAHQFRDTFVGPQKLHLEQGAASAVRCGCSEGQEARSDVHDETNDRHARLTNSLPLSPTRPRPTW